MKSRSLDMGFSSPSQMKFCADSLVNFAKGTNTAMIIVGHITKSGEIAGPKLIEHLVDVVVYFENDVKNNFRLLRSIKNRYGNVDDILFFSMNEDGLKIINNNFELIHSQNFYKNASGKCKSIVVEGPKTLLIEVESLLTPSAFANPRRFAEGIDIARLNRIIAIVNKHLGENLNNYDVYATITNGIKVKDVAVDFAVAMAIYTSKNNIDLDGKCCFIGELSLSGDIVNVKKLETRISELEKFGIDKIFVPNDESIIKKYKNVIPIDNIKQIKEIIKKK
jgi:DNA repair protein RadA/Sms